MGLAVMGQNLVLNIESRGYSVAVFNRTVSTMEKFVAGKCGGKKIIGAKTMQELAESLSKPRTVILMVKAGAGVDSMIDQLKPHFEPGDTIIDGGNSFFKDTERRNEQLTKEGLNYIGAGVSGGEEGALKGPSIMPGGQKEAYDRVAPIFEAIAAKTDDGPCVTYIGPRGAGHFVKMVHNGIEYGDMELICETYNILQHGLGYDAKKLAQVFKKWNQGVLSSYLIEITGEVLDYTDPDTNKALVDVILDKAGQKGTGMWTSQSALSLGVPIPTIDAAVGARNLSAFKDQRVAASKVLKGPKPTVTGNEKLIDTIHDALYVAKITSYAQGMALLKAASDEFKYDLTLADMARIWKGGCIIRAELLDKISKAFKADPQLTNLLMYPEFTEVVNAGQDKLREVVCLAKQMGLPIPAFNAALDYFDGYRSARVPANLIQGLRDYFGAHTYERVDKPGSFHVEWMEV